MTLKSVAAADRQNVKVLKQPEYGAYRGGDLPGGVLAFEQLAAALSGHPDAASMKNVAFIGPAEGVGVSTVSSNLASTMAASGQNVLLVTVIAPEGAGSVLPPVAGAAEMLSFVKQMPGGFFQLQVPASRLPQGGQPNDGACRALMQDLAGKYGYVIWDLPTVMKAPQSRLICQLADGVVLVIHAGKTRWHSARHTLDILKFNGTRVLGVVLNRKKVYIPEWLYRFLFRYSSKLP